MKKYIVSANLCSGYEPNEYGGRYSTKFRANTSHKVFWQKPDLLKVIEKTLVECGARTKDPARYAAETFSNFKKERIIIEM
jgi:hypothetical protein